MMLGRANMPSMNGELLPRRRAYMQPTESSSVPSTPLQQPHDLRFHSRSPSPTRRNGNQSPHSVVSEAIGHTVRLRSNGGVCRFETGAEIRKRRIPYVDGGNEELGPPKKELRKSLEPDERDKLSGDMRELYDRLLPTEESEQRRALLVKKLERILQEEYKGTEIRVNVFGSSGNLLSSTDSDVDICITTPLKSLNMHALAELLHKSGMENVVCRASAKVPIVKCWDPELKLAADLGVNNTLALENTRMIRTYVQLDERVRPLTSIIKYWTKRRILNDAAFGGTISSYTWICMIINFLQRRDPPVLPSLQRIQGKRKVRDPPQLNLADNENTSNDTNEEISSFADDVDALKGCGDANKESAAELLFQFFRHYGYEFDFSKYVVSVRDGRLLTRKEKGWDPSNYADKEARNRLCVEEPFTTNRNLGNSADDYAWTGIHKEIRRAFDLLADGCQLEKCCEQYEFPPEELKPVIQRAPPKPKPTLTRSASQSGRPGGYEGGSGRNRKASNRNASSQRSGNRRASSGASFNAQHIPLPFQTAPFGPGVSDYFAAKGSLHEQLASQWQYLQAQAEVLQRRLSQQQLRAQGQAGDLASSTHHGVRPYPLSLLNPQIQIDAQAQAGPMTAPIMPGYLYHYPPRYPLQHSPLAQARSRDGPSTNPSSPSLSAAIPALRRQVHRGSVPDGTSSSARSQSQPGRSLPLALSMSQQSHVPYDAAGALGGQQQPFFAPPQYSHTSPVSQPPYTPLTTVSALGQSTDAAMPKEYVGYYVGHSPQHSPQYGAMVNNMIPTVALRDPPAPRSRRITPELKLPTLNGKHRSPSPTPINQSQISSITAEAHPIRQSNQIWQSPINTDDQQSSLPPDEVTTHHTPESQLGGPLIVNGSNTGSASNKTRSELKKSSISTAMSDSEDDSARTGSDVRQSAISALPLRTKTENSPSLDLADTPETPSRVTPSIRQKTGPRLHLASPDSVGKVNNAALEGLHHDTISNQAPLLSPVAEMRTPSPTHNGTFDRDSPQSNGLMRAAQITVAKQNAERNNPTYLGSAALPAVAAPTSSPTTDCKHSSHDRQGSTPESLTAFVKLAKSPPLALEVPHHAMQLAVDKHGWQQAMSRKGHRKSKSNLGNGRPLQASGQPWPEFESERKGG